MKKTLLALALVAGFAGVAQAQSTTNVTLYGLVDVGVGYINSETADNTTALVSGVQSGSRWGLKGSEDLGNGLKANFQLESGFNADNGTSAQGGRLFGRWSWAGLSGGFGEVRLGRQWAASFELGGLIDPFGAGFNSAGIQSTFSTTNLRVDNALVYRTPNIGGFLGVIGYSFSPLSQEVPGTNNNPHAITAGAAYLNGPLVVLGTIETVNNPSGASDQRDWLIGGTYDFNVVKIHAAYGQGKHEIATSLYSAGSTNLGGAPLISDDNAEYLVGLSAPLGGGSALFSFQNRNDKAATDNDLRVISVGYTYPLSKRTNVYGFFADNDGRGAINDFGYKEFVVGLRHTF